MEFRFRAGDRGPSSSASGGCPPARLSNPRDGHFGAAGVQGPLPPPSSEWEAARREEIIQKEVKRRVIEEEVRREFEAKGDLAFAQGHHGGFGPGPIFVPGHFMPPIPMPMHPPPHAPPPMPMPFQEFGVWQGFNHFGLRPHAGFGERMPFLCEERRWSPLQPPKLKHKLQLLEIELSGRSEAPSSKTKVPRMKRKADTIVGPTVPKKVQKLTKDWSCALCQVSATSEAALNEHLEGRKHKAKLAQCGSSKVISDDKNNSRKVTGNKSATDPCDAPKKICILVDGVMHEVFQKNNYLWCDRCKVRCDSNVTMSGHLQSKKHSKLNKVWTSIEAVRTNTNTNEGLISPCESKVYTDDSTEITAVIKGDIDMAIKVDECVPVENPVEIKEESTNIASEINEGLISPCESKVYTDDSTEITAVIKGDIDMAIKVDECVPVENPVEIKEESTNIASEINEGLISPCESKVYTDDSTEITAVIKGDIDMAIKVDECVPVENPVEIKEESTNIASEINEGLISPCESKVYTDDSTEITAVIKGDIDMAIKVDECVPVENPVEIKEESTNIASEVDSTIMATKVHENSPVETPVETMKESTDMTNDVRQLVP